MTTEVGEIIKIIAAAATALAAWFAAITAYRGLEKWRSETLGKRKAELAATVLANVYEFAQILREARQPWVLLHETGKAEGIPDKVAQNANFVPERRLLEHQSFFARFRSLKHEYAAVFGRNAAKSFDSLWRIRLDINHAAHEMVNNEDLGKSSDPEDRKMWQEYYRVAFRSPDESKDEITKRIENEVAAVEAVCRPAIEARQSQ